MKAKTVKRLAILIAVLSLVGGTGFYTQQVRVKQTARAEMKKADEAWKNGDFVRAEELYRQLWVVFPDDVEIQIKHADAILAVDNSPKRVEQAIQIYEKIVKRMPGREDARRRLMQLKIDTAHFVSRGPQDEGADSDLKILVQRFPDDGKLLFLLGRCYEEGGNDKLAVEKYQEAIDHKAPQWIEAYQRCVSLLRGDRLKQPEEADRVINAADRVINAMVDADPDNYQVYLQRGRYRLSLAAKAKDPSSRQSLLSDAQSDFEEAKKRASNEPESYLELAKIAENGSRYGEAKSILEKGLKNVPTSAALYDKLAGILLRDQKVDKAIELLDDGLPKIKPATEQARLRAFFAELLARNGNTGKLRLQIEEMKKAGNAQLLIQYLTARYHMNMSEFTTARQLLTLIQPMANRTSSPTFKAQVNLLLAQCHGHLGELEKQRDANLRAYSAAPADPASRQTWIAYLLDQGKTEEAIKEYQAIVDRSPQVRLPLARLLMERNRQRPELERDWSEINRLIDKAAKDAPESAEPVVLRAEFLLAQGKRDVARRELETAQKLFPKNVKIWIARAKLLEFQERVDEALGLLDQAKSQLGDQVDLRLARAQLWAKKKGPEVAKGLVELAENIEGFSKRDRHNLLNGLAMQLYRQQNLEEASRLWSQLAEQEPKNMELRLNLLDLAFQIDRKDGKEEIEKNIKQIEEIEGGDGLMSRFCQARYLIWQAAQRADESNTREAQQTEARKREALRTEARKLLNELMSRRPEWSRIPIALAELEEKELDQGGLTDEKKQAKEKDIIGFYDQAIRLGHRSSAVVRRAVLLLIKNGRGNEAIELLNRVPVESQLASDLGRQAELFALKQNDFKGAEQIARKAIEARPSVFSERLRLVRILLADKRRDVAEAELRQAVDLSKSDPDRWINLVDFLVITKQAEKAEKAIRDAQANLSPSQAPLALAQCCEIIGKASPYEAARKWYDEAKKWYKRAEDAHPDDLSIRRRLTEFFLQTKQMSDAKAQLNEIRKLGGGINAAETAAWAKRTLALVLASGTDKQQQREALYCFEPNDHPAAIGQEGKALEDPEDLRILAQVLEAQKTVLQRKRAMEILESLVDKNLANSEDRFRLARLCELNGDWPGAREKYRELNAKTKVLPDMETLNRRPYYLGTFMDSLLRHRQSGDEQNLAEAQEVVDEIKQLQPTALGTLVCELRINEARNQLDKAAELIRAFADRPNLTSQVLEPLASEAEKLGQFELAKQLYVRRAAMPDILQGKLKLAAFFSRQGCAKDALDICEPLWANARDLKLAIDMSTVVLTGANGNYHEPNPAQLDRVAGWFDLALKQPHNERETISLLLRGLANIREQQGRYQDAKALYDRAIKQDDRDAVSYNNLAWLMALCDNNPAEALVYINRAIALSPNEPEFLDTRGIVYLTAVNIPGAISDLKKAVTVVPAPAKFFHLAQAYLAAKDKEKAKENLDVARNKGLKPNSLHPLERPSYEKMLNELGTPKRSNQPAHASGTNGV